MHGKETSKTAFDLHSWQGLTQVLKTGKDALKNPDAYAEFRDLVLEYAQKGGDAELRKKIDAAIASFGGGEAKVEAGRETEKKPEQPREEKKENPSVREEVPPAHSPHYFSGQTRRLQPVFNAAPQEVQQRETIPAPVVEAVPQESRPAPMPPPPEPAPTPMPQVEVKEEAPSPAPAISKAESPVSSEAFRTLDEHKARIAEIKRTVNAKVGNPAMLIDTHNESGKIYMKALLSALKVTGGGAGDVDAAMGELEKAFAALLEEKTGSQNTEEEIPVPEPIKSEPPAAPEPAPKPAAPKLESVREPYVPIETVAAEEVEEKKEERRPVIESLTKKDDQLDEVVKKVQKETATVEPLPAVKQEEPAPQTTEKPWRDGREGDESWLANRHVLKGVGKVSVEELKKESGIDPGEVATKQTELSSPEITETLHQLLNEWSIFHAKGIFGLGPSGPEHPLYKTLAPLSMGEVVAGRWEGADRKLTKVIKQYVDAWRHEQGIAYVISETFEHYLRRVVQRILKRQGQAGQ